MTDVNPAADPFLAWLETGTTSREEVVMFADQAGLREISALESKREKLSKRLGDPDDAANALQRSVGEKSPTAMIELEIADLDSKIDAAYARIEKSRSVWTLRPLRHGEVEEIEAKHKLPFMPIPNEEQQTTAKGKARYEGLMREYQAEHREVSRKKLLTQIATAVVTVTTPTAELPGVSVEQLDAMFQAEFGKARIQLLTDALDRLMALQEGPARPLSSTPSGSDPA